MHRLINLVFLSATVCLNLQVWAERPPWMAAGETAMVASDSAIASRIGADVLAQGGNAVDAAIATSFALGVTRPHSTGVGGGSFVLLRFNNGELLVLDARETAPLASTADMFVRARRADPEGPPASRYGFLAAAVPRWIQGHRFLHQSHATLPWRRLIAPSIKLAEEGFPVDENYVEATEKVMEVYRRYPTLIASCDYVYQLHLREGRLRAVGDPLVQPALGRLLRAIAVEGPEVLRTGRIARDVGAAMQKGGGIITSADLAATGVRRREPLLLKFHDFDVISMPPPSSGGIALGQTLNILEQLDYKTRCASDPAIGVHLQVEAMRQAFADRARWLGDDDFCDVPVSMLLGERYAAELALRITDDKTLALDQCGISQLPDDAGTSHFCVVDGRGTMVVCTETINTRFGSLAAVGEWGMILNNEMDDFSAEPGEPNAYGLVQSQRNAIAPGKRPLSSMSPTIVLKDGEPLLALGASGGPRIISSVLNVLLGVTVKGLSLEEAMGAPRPHHQWLPDEVFFDQPPGEELLRSLTSRGHRVSENRKTGVVQAIWRENGQWVGASDPHKGGRPAGN